MADIVIRQIEEGMTGRQVADLLYSNFLALVGAIGTGGGGDIPVADIEKGVTAYGWGDHRQAGYLKGITAGMVTGALGYTPMDEAAWTKANIKATLGIADWALAASKPTYTTAEVAEDSNLYFTDARAVAALAGVTDALAGDIGANATAIGVLQGYFTNGVAKSAAKLATSRKLWGQLFNGEADVTGALTGVTDITANGVLTIGKIKIGDGVIEWDAANGGFKVTGGLWATDYLSSKGVNTGASGGGGGGSSYQRLDTWDGYTSAKDGWVLSAKLGYGLKTTQDDILRQLADISGQGTNVTFTPALTSGTQIGTLTIDGEPVKMYAPSIPTADIEKGVTAYGWGNHASVGYAMASALNGYLPLSGGIVDGTIELRGASSFSDSFIYFSDKSTSERYAIGIRRPTSSYGLQYYMNGDFYYILHEGNYTDYTYSKSTIDGKFGGLGTFAYKSNLAFADLTNKPTTISGYGITDAYTKSQIDSALGGYLPLSGGTITGDLSLNQYLRIKAWVGYGSGSCDMWYNGNTGILHLTASNIANYHGETYIHSGNIGSQSVASAAKLTTARTIWGQSFDGTGNVSGVLTLPLNHQIQWADSGGAMIYGTSNKSIIIDGNVGIGTAYPTKKLHIYSTSSGYNDMMTLEKGGAYDVRINLINTVDEFRIIQQASGNAFLSLNGNNSLIFETSNTERMRITPSGHVEIGNQLWVKSYLNINRNGSTGAMYDTSRMGVEIEPYADYFTIRGYKSGSGLSASINITSSGNVGIGTTSPQYKLDVSGVIHSTTGIFSDGYVSAKGQNTSSDMRLKRVLEEVTLSVEDIAAAPAVRFAWKGGAGVDVGTSAQYWEKVLPDVVKRDDAGWLTMQYGNAAMVAVIALARRVKELEEKLKIKS